MTDIAKLLEGMEIGDAEKVVHEISAYLSGQHNKITDSAARAALTNAVEHLSQAGDILADMSAPVKEEDTVTV